MAIVFEMWAECAGQDDRAALVKHFDGLQMDLLTGRTIQMQARPTSWLPTGMIVGSPGLSNTGVRSVQDALETTECGIRLYHHLKIGPAFRFARVAWEAENIPSAELKDYVSPLMPGESHLEIEGVFHDSLYKQLGSPSFCHPFRDGYWWNRYSGERYLPLWGNDQSSLVSLHRSLFPEHFGY